MSLDHTPQERRTGTDRRLAIAAQNKPTGNGAIVLHEVLRKIDLWLNNASPNKTEGLLALRDDLCARAEVGERKYGTMLRINNGRRATVDLYQELMDALMYAQQARMENSKGVGGALVELLLELSRQVAAELDKQQ